MTSSIDARRDRASQVEEWVRRAGSDSFEVQELASGIGVTRHRAGQLLAELVKAGKLVRLQPGEFKAVAR